MKKLIRYSLKTLAWLVGIVIVLWLALWAYVELNEAKLIARISAAIHEKTSGEVKIGGASVSLIRSFPVLSLQLSDLVIRDSLYTSHHKDFFSASDVYLRISLKELIRGRSAIGRITINNGNINLITDSVGRSNEYILSERKASEGQPKSSVPVFILNNVGFDYQNLKKGKWYKGTIRDLKCDVTTNDKFVLLNLRLNTLIKSLSFNTGKGSYIKDSNLRGIFQLSYSKKDHDLIINHVQININEHPFYFDGYFRIDKKLSDFSLTIATNNIEFKTATALLPAALGNRFAGYDFSKPISPQVTINGQTVSGFGPDVRIRMQLDMSSVVRMAGITSLQYANGTGTVDITIVSSEKARDTLYGDLNGTIRISGVDIRYLPKSFALKQCSAIVRFNSNDVLIDSLSAKAGQTTLMMNGQAKNLITLGPGDPGKLMVSWKLSSPDLHIRDFQEFLSAGKFSSKQSSLDKLFSTGDIYVLLAAPKMDYDKFHATNVRGKVVMTQSGLQLQQVAFNHANGTMEMSGELKNGTRVNPVTLHTTMTKIDVPLLFAAFNNFGQDAITKNNLKGRLTAKVDLSTMITNQAKVSEGSSRGSVAFLLENGELNNFEPLIEVAKKAFKKQDFTNIKFADLKNRLDISGTTFIVNHMEIRSTAFTVFLEGVYDVKKGTDMSIRFPLRNITRSQSNTDLSEDAKEKKGIGLRLRAKTGDDGKLKVSWDPFRKSIKNRDQTKDSMDIKSPGK